MFVWLCTHNTVNTILQMPNVQSVILQVVSIDRFGRMIFLLGWTEDKGPLYSFPAKFEPKPNEISCGQFSYSRMTE